MAKKIVIAVSGSIAAYKSLQLVRLFVKQGCEVKVVMTPASTAFVSALSFATLSKHDVSVDLIDNDTWSNHVELGLWADIMIVAPATASSIAKMANGVCDNMLIATYLSAKCPVYVAPAMDLDMWRHPSTLRNIELLQSYGNTIIPVGHGELASGLVGAGRMAEPEDIVEYVLSRESLPQDLSGRHVVITAGPTKEAFDPVRFISNHSTGRMGICLATECADRGATVDLILGPTNLSIEHSGVSVTNVISAQDMCDATVAAYTDADIAILAAAVADYRPKNVSDEKIKKKKGDMTIELERTPDIAQTLGVSKKPGQLTIGFALETQNALENAKSKLERKNFDFIVLNSLKDKGAGFQHNTNKVSIVHKGGDVNEYPLKSKREVAHDIINEIIPLLK